MIRISSLILAGLVLGSTASFAAPAQYSATLSAPVSGVQEFIVNTNAFRCEGATCKIVSAPNDASSVSTCRKLVKKVGTLTAYGSDKQPFSADQLAECNK